ncbi:MAG: class I SAM-dependent methyltransferase [Chitinophagales bacterium]|nr:class I SAM-dependent methyltransferase [Chitinophagales bacterium]
MELESIARNLQKRDDGIYYALDSSPISYPEIGNEYCLQIEKDSFWFNHRNRVIVEAVKKYSKDKMFFDIGGGNGYVSLGLQEAGVDVVLVEPGPVGSLNAKKRGIDHVICSTLQDAKFEKASLDTVGMFDVVEHIENDVEFLRETNEYLKEDGMVYITVPAFNFLWSNEDKEAGHYRRYSLSMMEKALNKANFDVVYSTYIFTVLPLPIFFFRVIPSKLGMNKDAYGLEKRQKEHKSRKGMMHNTLQKIWDWELEQVKKGEKIGFGGSCFVVGRKKN